MEEFTEDTNVMAEETENKCINACRNVMNGISTGFIDLDYHWGGLVPGKTYLIAAELGMGKTALALNMILNITKCKQKAVIFSTDSSKEHLINRMFTMNSYDEEFRFCSDEIEDKAWERVTEVAKVIAEHNLIIDDTYSLDVDDLDSKLSLKMMSGAKVVFLDYLELMGAKFADENGVPKTAYICNRLRKVAAKHNVAIIAINRVEDKDIGKNRDRAVLMGMGSLGEISSFFDNVSFIYREKYYNCGVEQRGIAEIITHKNFNGPVGTVRLIWVPKYQRFCNPKVTDFLEDNKMQYYEKANEVRKILDGQ